MNEPEAVSGIELRHLRYFVAVAEELHFGRAASRLNMAQPPLSQQIQRLEQLIGHQLFQRTSRAVSLTVAGNSLLERARRILRSMQEDVGAVRRAGRGETGILRVGFVGSAMLTGLPAILRQYRRLYPDVELRLFESFTSQVIESVRDFRADVGILRDGGSVPDLTITPLLEEKFIALLPARHPLAARPRLRVNDLRKENFVFYPASAGRAAWERTMHLFEKPHIVQEAPHWVTIVSLVGAGFGVSVAPACIRKLIGSAVVAKPLAVSATTSIELAHRPGESNPVALEFIRLSQKRRQL
jgi:DNA-binding transcriptional LysR family regulator